MPLLSLPSEILQIVLSFCTIRSLGILSSSSRRLQSEVERSSSWIGLAREEVLANQRENDPVAMGFAAPLTEENLRNPSEAQKFLQRRTADLVWGSGMLKSILTISSTAISLVSRSLSAQIDSRALIHSVRPGTLYSTAVLLGHEGKVNCIDADEDFRSALPPAACSPQPCSTFILAIS